MHDWFSWKIDIYNFIWMLMIMIIFMMIEWWKLIEVALTKSGRKKEELELNLSLWQVRWYAIRDTQKLILRTINYTQLTLKLSANKIGTHLDKWMRYKAKENIYTVKLALEYIWILALICIIKMTSYDIGLIIRHDRLVMIYLHTKFGRIWTNGCWVMKQRKMPVVRMRTVGVLWDSRRDI